MTARSGPLLLAALLMAAGCSREQPPQPKKQTATAGANTCRECHAAAVESFAGTGMGRSFGSAPPADATPAWLHKASNTWFQLIARDGALYHRRWQIGLGGKEENVEELRADYVMGSGNRVRTYLHRTRRNTLIELPLARYADGVVALNPGFDTASPPTRRRLGYDCMFCHNANLAVPAGHEESYAEPVFPAALPAGIDCERCHGPAADHVQAARQPKPVIADLRRTIVNPARLTPGPANEVCMQCHLETTSSALPNMIRRFDRRPYSYRPGEPLDAFAQFYDHPPGAGRDDKFEIVSSVYRMRQSACFVKSGGQLTCVRCHNPHQPAADPAQRSHYNAVCWNCHASAKLPQRHPAGPDCTSCHMPKRRAEDVVRAVMTDHRIARPTRRDLTAALGEKHGDAAIYHGRVAAYYPPAPKADPLYLAAAQVISQSNLQEGIAGLQRLMTGQKVRWEFHVVLGDALNAAKRPAEAMAQFRAALEQRPQSAMLMRRLAAVAPTRNDERAWIERATQADPQDGAAWYDLGVLEREQRRLPEALAALRRAAREDPDSPEIATTLSGTLAESGDPGAESALRNALSLNPYDADAAANLAVFLAAAPGPDRRPEAIWQFERALRYGGDRNPKTRFNYGAVLGQAGRLADAEREMRAALRLDPQMADAHYFLGGLFVQRDDLRGAVTALREALRHRPEFAKARLDLGMLLLAQGQPEGVEHLKRAAAEGGAEIRAEAARALAGTQR